MIVLTFNWTGAAPSGLRHIGQPLSIDATVSAQLPQKRAWPHGTSATLGTPNYVAHFLQRRLSITLRFPRFPVPRFPPLWFGAGFSSSAFFSLAFSAPPTSIHSVLTVLCCACRFAYAAKLKSSGSTNASTTHARTKYLYRETYRRTNGRTDTDTNTVSVTS